MRTHVCPKCGLVMDRDENAARNILAKALVEWEQQQAQDCTVGQTGTDAPVSA